MRVNVRSFLVYVEEIAAEEPGYRKEGCGKTVPATVSA